MILRSELLVWGSLLTVPAYSIDTRSSESRPRGVGPEFAKFYKSTATGTFTCISHPSIVIPFLQVNDDYCDCPDGSDEPGTAACSYLSPLSPPQYRPGPETVGPDVNVTLALPGFYCKNKGHIPSYIRFESVNDGRCDYDLCCDGSDEWQHVGGKKCEDRCKEIGKEYKTHEEARQKVLRGAFKRRKELMADANKRKKEIELKVEALEISIRGNEIKVKEAQDTLSDVERREKLRVIKGDAVGKGNGKLGVLVGLARDRVAELRSYLSKTKEQRDAMVARITELEDLLANLKKEYNPNFNDEGVKRAVRGWEDYAARDTTDNWTEAEDRDLESIMREDNTENGVNWAEFESGGDADSDVAQLYQFSNYLPPTLRIWVDEKVSSFRKLLVDSGILADNSTPGSAVAESKAVQDARRTLSDAERDLTNSQNDINREREDLKKDYGPDGIFRALKDVCISKDSGEYTYELCFMANTKQKSKKGGGDTIMGHFTGFDIEVVDEEVPLDGRGLGKGERIVMKYENGQHCWNGPNRSTKVILACSEKDEIWKVSESEKCVYRMEVGSSAVCRNGAPAENGAGGTQAKDEL